MHHYFSQKFLKICRHRFKLVYLMEASYYLVSYVGVDDVSEKITDLVKILLLQNWQPIVDLYRNLRFHLLH